MKKNSHKYKKKIYKKGLYAEKIVLLWLRLKGWHIIKYNYQSPFGQIDIIAQKKKHIAAIEVKLRQNLTEDPVGLKQKQRIHRSFSNYIEKYNPNAEEYSIDLIIYKPPFSFRHIQHAW